MFKYVGNYINISKKDLFVEYYELIMCVGMWLN